MSKLHIKKGDTVYVLAGEDRGKTGRVLSVEPAKARAIVEGINMVTKATKPSAQHPQGGLVKKEAPIHISNLQDRQAHPHQPASRGRKDHPHIQKIQPGN